MTINPLNLETMKFNIKNKTKIILIFLFLLMLFAVVPELHAQFEGTPLDFNDDVNDAGTAPINGLVGIALAVGAYFGARKLRKK